MTEQTTKRVTKSLWAKLAQAQAAVGDVPRRGRNPFTKSTYVTLDDLLRALNPALSEAGLTVFQAVERDQNDLVLSTTICDPESGERYTTSLPLPAIEGNNAAQALGSAITYARRYVLSALFMVAGDEDTDAETQRPREHTEPQPPTEPTEPRSARPYPPAALKAMLARGIEAKRMAGFTLPDDRANNLRGVVVQAIDTILDHHVFGRWLGIPESAAGWDNATLETLRRWLRFHKSESGEWQIDGNAGLELAAVARELEE